MANDVVMGFIRRLFAASTDYKAAKEQREDAIRMYFDELSRYELSESEWKAVLRRIIDDHPKGDLPAPGAIHGYIKSVETERGDSSDLGWCTFTVKEHRYALRIKSVGGRWMRLQSERRKHKDFPFGKYTQTETVSELRLPPGAQDIRYAPDAPAQVTDADEDEFGRRRFDSLAKQTALKMGGPE